MNWERAKVTVKYLFEDTTEVHEQTLEALVAEGLFAVHKSVEGMYENSLFTCCLTHVPSGYRISKFFNSYRARAFAEVLVERTGLDVWRFVHQEDKPTLTGEAATLIAIEQAVFESLFEEIADLAYGDDLPKGAEFDGSMDDELIRGITDQLRTAYL